MKFDGIVLMKDMSKAFEENKKTSPYYIKDKNSAILILTANCLYCGSPYFERMTHNYDCPVRDCAPVIRKWIIDFIYYGCKMNFFRETDPRYIYAVNGLYSKE